MGCKGVLITRTCYPDADDLLNIDHLYLEGMVNKSYPTELQLNGYRDSHHDRLDDFDFDIIVFVPIWDGDVSRRTRYCAFISQLFFIIIARICRHVTDDNVKQPNFSSGAICIIK